MASVRKLPEVDPGTCVCEAKRGSAYSKGTETKKTANPGSQLTRKERGTEIFKTAIERSLTVGRRRLTRIGLESAGCCENVGFISHRLLKPIQFGFQLVFDFRVFGIRIYIVQFQRIILQIEQFPFRVFPLTDRSRLAQGIGIIKYQFIPLRSDAVVGENVVMRLVHPVAVVERVSSVLRGTVALGISQRPADARGHILL